MKTKEIEKSQLKADLDKEAAEKASITKEKEATQKKMDDLKDPISELQALPTDRWNIKIGKTNMEESMKKDAVACIKNAISKPDENKQPRDTQYKIAEFVKKNFDTKY